MVALFVIGAFIPRTFLRTAGVFCLTSIILVNELHLAYVLWNQNSEKKQQPFVDLIVFVVVCIVLYLMHKPKVFTDFLMIDVMELLFLIELICTIFIDLKGKK